MSDEILCLQRLKDYADAYISANSLNVASEMNAARLKHKTELEEIKARVLEERPLVPRHDKVSLVFVCLFGF